MQDNELVELYFQRSEQAIAETADKYGKYCLYIADNILCSREDSEETVNDAYAALWKTIPPHRPENLKAYLARTVHNIALDRIRKQNADMRGSGGVAEVLDELKEAATSATPETELDASVLGELINGFIGQLEKKQRIIFVKRYWFMCSSKQISEECGVSVSDVNTTLHRTRLKLKKYLEQEGFSV